MKTSLTIPIHSFVDLITNSSSEVFVTATEKTVGTIKSLVDNILAAAGSPLKSDDLFKFQTIVEGTDEDTWDEVEFDLASKEGEKYWKKHKDDENSPRLSIWVTVKGGVEGKESAELAAKTLSALDNLFDISERYN